jgi:hypothetical protein
MDQTVADVFGLDAPKPYKGKQNPDKCSNDALMVGVELEIENIPNGATWYQERTGSFWSVVEDGSLRPRNEAWEFVSRPAMLGTTLAELRLLFQKFGFNDDNYSDRTSVHVHTNVQDFTQAQIANLALVYPVFESVLFQFVNHYKAKEKQGYCRDTNLYCVPWSQCRMNRNFIEKFFDDPSIFVPDRRGLGTRQWEKYTALNFIPISEKGTVEWRHMHGTADMEKLSIWLNIIGSVMKFCKSNSFDDIVKTIKVLNDVSTYHEFFTSVLGDTLPYLEEYRQPMAEGVVNAKYSLMNWEVNKNKPKEKKSKKAAMQQHINAVADRVVVNEPIAFQGGWVTEGEQLEWEQAHHQLEVEAAQMQADQQRATGAPNPLLGIPDPFANLWPPAVDLNQIQVTRVAETQRTQPRSAPVRQEVRWGGAVPQRTTPRGRR